jgi:quercetin dioxygenase-like cupin family protein
MKPQHSWTTEDWSARLLQADYGHSHDGHEHWTDHVTVIVRGPVRIEIDHEAIKADRGDAIVIKAGVKHRFVPLHARGAAWRCVFSYEHAMRNGVSRENFDKDK